MVSMAERPQPDPEARTEAAALLVAQPPSPTLDGPVGPALVGNRYEILGMLGSGGMGTVYRARDRELDEIVALKVLKAELAATSGMLERFRREVKLARRVTHKNVARTFDIGEHEGDRFLTMELIEGEMLGSHLARRGRVSLRNVIRIGIDVCAGLAAAHAAGVLHRDLKPENVILARDGRAVITDFGIARALAQADLARTAAGMVGTPAYMAPEQVEGSADLDGRADLYALGTMLFELLTGELAWPGDSVIAIAAARLLRPPPDARTFLPELPDDAAELVLKLMARARDDRFASAEEAGAALAALPANDLPSARSLPPRSADTGRATGAGAGGVTAGTPTTGTVVMGAGAPHTNRKTVAVLPLVNLGVEDDAYLAQTVTEDLVDLLSMVRDLRVRPRGETAAFATANRDVREVGRSLGVDVVVDGSLRRHGDSVRVTVRLVTVEDGFQLWAQRFDRPAAQVLTVADDAAAAVANALATQLATSGAARPVVGDAAAQDLYLRGRYLVQSGWFDVSREGARLLGEAHRRAPDDPRIAGTYALAIARVLSGDPNDSAGVPDPRELAEKALAIDPQQVQARVALGFVHLNNAESVTAATLLKRALALAPNAVEALDVVGRVLLEVGRSELGIATLRRALAIDSTLAQARQSIGRGYALLGDYDSAFEALGTFPTNMSDVAPYVLIRGRIAMWRNDRVGAQQLAEELGRSAAASIGKFRMHALLKVTITRQLTDEINREVDAALPIDSRLKPRRVSFHAQIRTELKLGGGRIEEALADLRVADSNGLLDRLWLDRCPLFDLVRDRPEYLAIQKSTTARAERVAEILA
ncbi:MAG: eukaryotic-like serine/threonine-protein kinase [Myxococcales bacterium]|jgi:serine/threonine-protein kinase|nr:eukaryotic-like serine/threonine-protein kinase [Myxococcales bacterium]